MIWISLSLIILIILIVIALLWLFLTSSGKSVLAQKKAPEEATKSQLQQAKNTLATNIRSENLEEQKKQKMEIEETDHSEIILLAELSPRYQDTEKHPVQIQYNLKRDKGAFYYQNNILRSTKFVQSKCFVMNSGTTYPKEELYDQEEVPLKNLVELMELTKQGCVFDFEFDSVRDVWRGNLKKNTSGESYNTVVYIDWRITLVLDLIQYTYEYDSYCYNDTST